MKNKVIQQSLMNSKNQSLYKIVLSDFVETKIREWCAECPHNEWSGTLFYKTEGSLDTNNLIVNVVDFFVSDIGTETYTVYDFNEEVVAYMTENNLLDCYCGLVHSHQQMAAFFSGTDTATLNKEGASMPHFVSLIVNNAGKYVAKITRQVVKEFIGNVSGYYLSFNSEKKFVNQKPATFKKSEVESFDLEVIKPEIQLPVSETHRRAEEIREKKKKETTDRFSNWGYTKAVDNDSNLVTPIHNKNLSFREPELFDEWEDFYKNQPVTSITDSDKSNNYDFPTTELCLYVSKLLQGSDLANYMSEAELKKFIGKGKNSPMKKAIKTRFPQDTDDEYCQAVDNIIDMITEMAFDKRDGNVAYGFKSSLTTNLYEFIDGLSKDNTNEYLNIVLDELIIYQSTAEFYE